jgi:hypothetical protein
VVCKPEFTLFSWSKICKFFLFKENKT